MEYNTCMAIFKFENILFFQSAYLLKLPITCFRRKVSPLLVPAAKVSPERNLDFI